MELRLVADELFLDMLAEDIKNDMDTHADMLMEHGEEHEEEMARVWIDASPSAQFIECLRLAERFIGKTDPNADK